MRGIFSVLGLNEASSTVIDMRDRIQEFAGVNYDFESARIHGIFDKFGNNLGALGFLIDMLSYQPALVKKLFVFDTKTGTLNPLMGRVKQTIVSYLPAVVPKSNLSDVSLQSSAESISNKLNLNNSADTVQVESKLNDEFDLKEVFLEEAGEVIEIGLEAIYSLLQNPENLEAQSVVRRTFHTLKGSSRMVGFHDFGEAAWAFEQLVNTRLADQQPFDYKICKLSVVGLNTFKLWMIDLRLNVPTTWNSMLIWSSI